MATDTILRKDSALAGFAVPYGTSTAGIQKVALVDGDGNDASAGPYDQLGYQQLSNATLAASTALTVPANATAVIIQNNGSQPARWRPDGATTAPTASTGLRIAAGDELRLQPGNAGLTTMRFIREADGVTLDIAYFG